MKKISSQREWQLKQVAKGKCSICTKKLFKGELCVSHYEISRKRTSLWHKKNRDYHLALMKIRRDKLKKQ